eukprot:scaffold96688_cov69-Phaeocystis_antarctica.AAC.1
MRARCWLGPVVRVRLKATVAIAPSTTESTNQGQASGTTAHKATPRPSERHAACCWMRAAVAVWPFFSAHHRAVWSSPSSSSVFALARSSACTHDICPPRAACMRAVTPPPDCMSGLAECCRRILRTERWPWSAAAMSAVSTHAPRFSSSVTISRWPLAVAACRRAKAAAFPSSVETAPKASTDPPLRSHLITFCSSPRAAD